jgi:hypothetical protein
VADTAVPDGESATIGYVDKEGPEWQLPGKTLADLVDYWVLLHDHGCYRWNSDEQRWNQVWPSECAAPKNEPGFWSFYH